MTKTVSKAYLAKKVSTKTGISQDKIKVIMNLLTEEIIKNAKKSKMGKVEVEGLGIFKSVSSKREGRITRNPEIKHTIKSPKGHSVPKPSGKTGLLKVGDPLEYGPLRYWLVSPLGHNELREKDEKTGQDNIERRETLF